MKDTSMHKKSNPNEVDESCLNDHEWAEVHKIACDMLSSGKFGTNQFKISVLAFMMWASYLEILDQYQGTKH